MRRRGCYFVGVFLYFASGGQLSVNSGRKSTPSCQPISSHVAAWKPGHFLKTTSLYPPVADTARWFPKNAGRNPWFLHLLCCVLHPVEEDGVHLHYIALSFRWNLYRQSKGIFIRGPRQNKQSGFVGERRHSTVIDACRLRRAERYKACVDDMPFDCPLRPRAEGVEIGFYLIITDVPLCCAVCPVPT